jgi:hypothetical protein
MDRYSFCKFTGKIGHATYFDTLRRVKSMLRCRKGDKRKGESVSIYLCQFCNKYHFGFQLGPRKKRREEPSNFDEE